MGRFNVYNLLASLSVGLHLGADLSVLASIFTSIPAIPGRLEQWRMVYGIRFSSISPIPGEALDNVLSTLREIGFAEADRRLRMRRRPRSCEANGDGSRCGKVGRSLDRHIATTLAMKIRWQSAARSLLAFKDPKGRFWRSSGKAPSDCSVELACPGDIVLIAGKGHERTQIFGSQTIPFDDCLIAKEALQNRQLLQFFLNTISYNF